MTILYHLKIILWDVILGIPGIEFGKKVPVKKVKNFFGTQPKIPHKPWFPALQLCKIVNVRRK